MKPFPSLVLLSLLLLSTLSWPTGISLAGEDPMRGPWDRRPTGALVASSPQAHETSSPAASFLRLLVTFFQRVISPVDGDRCPSYPTCSTYSIQAYEQHGAVLGTLMTVDRLFHEDSEGEFAPVVEVHGVRRIYDPVWANEFWKEKDGGKARTE
jgi:putative component of membrane protein insertase Oxa1/YidC/SpoIIIJ protein YidD